MLGVIGPNLAEDESPETSKCRDQRLGDGPSSSYQIVLEESEKAAMAERRVTAGKGTDRPSKPPGLTPARHETVLPHRNKKRAWWA